MIHVCLLIKKNIVCIEHKDSIDNNNRGIVKYEQYRQGDKYISKTVEKEAVRPPI